MSAIPNATTTVEGEGSPVFNFGLSARTSNIPADLRDLDQWVCWKLIGRNGKKAKMPFRLDNIRDPADSTDPATWGKFSDAVKALKNRERNGITGIGFVFSCNDPFCGVDLDNSVADGQLLDWARPIVDCLMPTYAEISPSGTGIKLWVRGKLSGKGTRKGDFAGSGTAVEIYDQERFFTTTGRVISQDHRSISERSAYLGELYESIKPKARAKGGKGRSAKPTARINLRDGELIAKARKGKGGPKFSALFDGSTEGHASASEADLALCTALSYWTGGDVEAIDRLFRQSALYREEKWERDSYRDPTIAKACDRTTFYDPNYRSVKTPTVERKPTPPLKIASVDEDVSQSPEPPRDEPTNRPTVEVNTQRHTVLEETLKALGNDPETYRRGPFLVRVVRETRDETRLTAGSIIKNVSGSPKIINLADAVIGTRLTKYAEFFSWKKDKNGESVSVQVHPPEWLIKAIGSLEHWPMIRRLLSVVECPFPRPNGSIVETPGYDRETSTLYLPAEPFPKVPKRASRDDARAAWDRLKHYVRDFPFKTEDDRVVYLAGMLNVIGRTAIEGPVMGIAVIGNKAGTGKGLLIDVMTLPGIGRPAPTTNYPTEKEEANKVKVAIVLSGKPVVNFDNLDEGSTYGGSVIDSALTAYTIDERILGASKNTGDLEVRTSWFLSGNNLNPAMDAYRRWMVCNLETEYENPEHREDIEDKSLRKLITERRGEIVRDALTILRAHAQANWPNGGWSPVGSFEEWDRVVRGAVWFATGRDCLATQKEMAKDSPERLAKIALLEGWRELPGGKSGESGLTTVEALKLIEETPSGFDTLRIALMQRGRGGKLPDSRMLGNILRGLKNSLIGGYRLRDTGVPRHQAVCWVVEQVSKPDPGVWPEGRE